MKRTQEEIIDDMRKIVKPGIMNLFKRLNYENLGDEDAAEFAAEFDEVLNLAEKSTHACPKTPVLSHSEITNEIYVYFGNEKYDITPYAVDAVVATHRAVSTEEIEKAYESIMDVAEGGYVDIEEVKVHFCKWLGKEDV